MERRSFLFANLTVLFAAIVVSTSFGASLVETVIHMSRYFADPPASFATWYGDQTHSTTFWMPLQLGGLILLIAALAANWRFSVRKRLLAIGLVGVSRDRCVDRRVLCNRGSLAAACGAGERGACRFC